LGWAQQATSIRIYGWVEKLDYTELYIKPPTAGLEIPTSTQFSGSAPSGTTGKWSKSIALLRRKKSKIFVT
jgi:hypothetical protein